ncbi:acetolactate synthase small subunit [Natrialba hulunbeirensis JCM 10989]|uniref:Acetolactate synthase small subunit n=1 Tax=Natrialba hulunbeirensis JCM 10989 TaxID=1227493 RepID=M0A3K1_9EURY|nr:acetolactate synthase small subunit [Natrialba hulunbeirensis]ELY93345.1 acetolactate synthase small subunit [Natrialba hulunbeirensis JCM 10989]
MSGENEPNDRTEPTEPGHRRGLDGPAPEERPTPAGRRNEQGIRIDPEVEAKQEPRRTVISTLVEHEPGVLSDVSGLFSRRQFNIESLTVGPTTDDDRARITLVVEEPDPGIDQIKKQLRKLIPVISVRELESDAMRRELALVKIDADRPSEVAAVADMYDGKTVDSCPETATIEITGSRQKIDAAIETFEQFGIREIDRTGTTALARGTQSTAAPASTTESTAEAASHPQNQYAPADDD